MRHSRRYTVWGKIFSTLIVLAVFLVFLQGIFSAAQVLAAQSKITEEKVKSKKAKRPAKLIANEIDPLADDEGDLKFTTALSEDEKSALKKKYPCNPIYLSSRGVCAGTGDPGKIAGAALKMGFGEHPLALELSELPKDQYGLVDWAEALRIKAIEPWESIKAKRKRRVKKPMDLDLVIKTKSKFIPDVVFPHKIHTMWLNCSSCHPKIFKREIGGNPAMTMPKIAAGEYCGRCHNRVAFPLSDCLRCHVKSKDSQDAQQATK